MLGKFIVIDGTDGSGKTTQTEILIQKLKSEGYAVEMADFPQYNTKSAGLVENYLEGKYGGVDEVDAKIASIFYAADRYDASFKIRQWLEDGKIVVSNRYVTANMGHQGAKLVTKEERQQLFDWLDILEYGTFKIPRPDLNIILHVPAEVSQKLVQARIREDWKGKTNDIHQNSFEHLKRAEETYLEITELFNEFKLIECAPEAEILTKEEIADSVWKIVKEIL
ncbi:MAG: deoxynucleoside kinase [Patescibacteria group bacterium]